MKKEDLTKVLKAAKKRDVCQSYFVGSIHAYCENRDCTARQIRVVIKETAALPESIHCPLCGKDVYHIEIKTIGEETPAVTFVPVRSNSP